MPINADKPHLWKKDVDASVDFYNDWFMRFAPKAYRDARKEAINGVQEAIQLTKNLTLLNPELFKSKSISSPNLADVYSAPNCKRSISWTGACGQTSSHLDGRGKNSTAHRHQVRKISG